MGKTLEKDAENFVASTTRAMQNYKKFLYEKRGLTGKYLVEKTIDYGIAMLNTGLGKIITPKMAEEIFIEQAAISTALAEYCKEISNYDN